MRSTTTARRWSTARKSENYHGFDERVFLPSVKRVTAAIALFIADWCGVEKISL